MREDPNNSYTHANYGWGLLEKGNHKKALEHFKTTKNHQALIVDEHGIFQGIITLNDILEALVGDASDFDDDEQQ